MSRQPDTADRQLAHIGGRRAPMPPGHVLSRKWPRLRRRPGWLGQASRGRRGPSRVPRYARSTTTSPVHQAEFIRASCGEEWPEARVCGCVFERYRLVISLRAHRQPASDLPIRRLLVLSQRSGPSCSDRPVRRAARPCQQMSCRRPTGPGGVHGAASFPYCSGLSGPPRGAMRNAWTFAASHRHAGLARQE